MRDRDSPAEVGANALPPGEREHGHVSSFTSSPVWSGPARWGSWIAHHLGQIANAFAIIVLVAWFIFAALILTLRYVVLPHVDDYREAIENLATRAVGESVKIGAIDASWRGLRPTLALRDVRVVDRDGKNALELPTIRATLSWDTLVVMDLRLALLEIDGPELAVRRDADGQLFVAGYPIKKKAAPDNRAAEWILAQNEIRIRHAHVTWRDEMPKAATPGPTTPAPPAATATPAVTDAAVAAPNQGPDATAPELALSNVDFALVRSGWRHRFALRASPPATLAAPIDIRAVVDHPLFASRLAEPSTWHGELYANVGSGDLTAWRAWLPLPAGVESGRGRVRAWVRFASESDPAGSFARSFAPRLAGSDDHKDRSVPSALDRLADVTTDLALDDVAVHWGAAEPGSVNHLALAAIDGRIAASQTAHTQKLAARKLALRPQSGAMLAATDLEIERKLGDRKDDESGTARVSAVDIGTVIGLVPASAMPASVAEKLAALRPRGALDQIAFKWNGAIAAPTGFRFDARFAGLAMAPQAPTPEAIKAATGGIVGPNGLVKKPRPPFGQPGFENLAGTLNATRVTESGGPSTHLAINLRSADASLIAPGLFDDPLLKLARLDADVGVQIKGSDIEVRVQKAAAENPDLAATAELTFRRGPHSGSEARGWIDLDARFLRANVARVPRYLPNIISEKARAYLAKSLVSGKVTEGSLRMHGALEKLDLRAQPDALAKPNPIPIASALVTVRDASTTNAGARAANNPNVPVPSDENVFHALIKVQGATFLYGPAKSAEEVAASPSHDPKMPAVAAVAWPAFEDVDADVVFDRARMTVNARSARVYGYKLTDVKAELPALADPEHVLRVVGKGNGPLQDLVRFVNASPVAQWTRHFTDSSQGTGNAVLALALDLPLTHARDAEVAGSIQLAGNDLAVNALAPPLTRLNGRVDFTDKGLTIAGVTGQALGGPIRIDAATRSDGYIDLNAEGTLEARTLRASAAGGDAKDVIKDAAKDSTKDAAREVITTPTAMLIPRIAQRLDGSARYTVSLRLRSKRLAEAVGSAAATTPGKPDVVIESNLAGLTIDLPAPLAKSAAESWPLRIEMTRSATGGSTHPAMNLAANANAIDSEDIRVALAGKVNASISRRRNPQGQFVVTRAAYAVGDEAIAADGPPSVRVDLPSLDLDAWRDAIKQIGLPRPASPEQAASIKVDNLIPERVNLKTRKLHVAGRDFDNVSFDAQHVATGWQGNVVADQIAGKLSYIDVSDKAPTKSGFTSAASSRLVARLARLTIPKSDSGSAQVESALDASKQKDFPAIDLVADRFELRGRALGRLEVVAENVGRGDTREWQLEKLGLTTPEASFTAKGVWGHAGSSENTKLDFNLESSDVGALLDRFGVVKTVKNGTAKMSGNVGWNGGPTAIDFATMTGRLKLEADKGQFLKADPGIAKLLGVLSLQSLPRRFLLDFSDVFEKGFAFDTIRADATVAQGVVSTDDFKMMGVQATVLMSGSADLERETQNLHVLVLPEINAGAASLGYALINPAVGLATFVAQYLFKDPIARALSLEYNVTGPWVKPNVTKIDHAGNETPVVPRESNAARDADDARTPASTPAPH